jgi:hypothetical protein
MFRALSACDGLDAAEEGDRETHMRGRETHMRNDPITYADPHAEDSHFIPHAYRC